MKIIEAGIWQSRRTLVLVFILLAGLLITGMATLRVKEQADEEVKREFDVHCREMQDKIIERFLAHAQLLRSAEAFIAGSDYVSRQKWQSFCEHQKIDEYLHGVQGLGFALLIPREKMAQHIKEIRAEGFPEYQIRPEGERELYSSVIYIGPFTGRNLRAFGYDMLTEPVRRAAMERARDLNEIVLSGKVRLVQETALDVQAGTLMFFPVYRKNMFIETVDQRRAAIKGWVYSPYRMADLMNGIFGMVDLKNIRGIHLKVFDGEQATPATLLYDSQPTAVQPVGAEARVNFQRRVVVANRPWTLCFTMTDSPATYAMAWLVVLGGTTISLLLAGFAFSLLQTEFKARHLALQLTRDLSRLNAELEKRVEERTADLAAANLEALNMLEAAVKARQSTEAVNRQLNQEIAAHQMALEKLRKSETRFRSYFDLPLYGIAITSPEKGWIEVNGRLCSMLGYSRDEILRMSWSEMTYPDDLSADVDQFERMLSGQIQQYQLEKRFICKDGKVIWINLAVGCVKQDDGKVEYFIAVLEDITERKRADKERGYLSAIVDSSEDAIIGKDLTGIITSWNMGAERIYGYSAEEVIGRHIAVLFPSDQVDDISKILDEIRRGVSRSAFETVRIRKDGSAVEVSLTISPIRISSGEIAGAATIARDITDRKQIEAALLKAQSILKVAMDQSTTGIAIADATDGVLRYVNDAGLLIRGGDRQSLVNGVGINEYVKSWQLLDFDGSPLKEDEVPLTRAILFGETSSREFIIRRADNDDRIVSANASPIIDAQGKIVSGIVVFTDITDHKKLESEKLKIEELNRQINKDASLGRMAGAVAHHFNNQLHVVQAYLNMVIDELPAGDSRAEDLEIAVQAAKKASDVSSLMITYLGQNIVEMENIDFAEHVRMNLPVLQERKPPNVNVGLELPSPGPVIKADVRQIQQILINLVINAFESIGDRAGTVHLRVKTVSSTDIPASHRFPADWTVNDHSYACLRVMDSGCGMRKTDFDKLFEPFFSTKSIGRGLGLPVVLGIVRSHNGGITVEAGNGGGSVFSVFFPLSV